MSGAKKLSSVFLVLILLSALKTARADLAGFSFSEIQVAIEHPDRVEPGSELRVNVTVQRLEGLLHVNRLSLTLQHLQMNKTLWERGIDVLVSETVGEPPTRTEHVVVLPSTLSPGYLYARVSVDYGPSELADENRDEYLSFVESPFRSLYEGLEADHRILQSQFDLIMGDYEFLGLYTTQLESRYEVIESEIALVRGRYDRLTSEMSTTLEYLLLSSFPLNLPVIEYALLVAVGVLAVAVALLFRRRGSDVRSPESAEEVEESA